MLTAEDIKQMYIPSEQPVALENLNHDDLFSIYGDPFHFFRVIASNEVEVIVKTMNDTFTKYFSLPTFLNVHKYVMKH